MQAVGLQIITPSIMLVAKSVQLLAQLFSYVACC